MESQNNDSEPLFIFKCVSKSEILVFEIDTEDGQLDISKLLANFEGGIASGAANVGRLSPEKNIPSLRRPKKRVRSEKDPKSPVLEKHKPITSEHRRGENNPTPPLPKGNALSLHQGNYKTTAKHHLNHSKIHSSPESKTGEKPPDKYNQRVNVNSRLWTYIGDKPYSCHICDFKCIRKVELKHHLITHTGKKPFACDKCNFICNFKIILKHHSLTHSSEKPFECDMCDFKCKHKNSLTHHLRTHTGEKPYACHKCSFKCSQNTNLKRHLLSHSDWKPFACRRCDYKSCRRDNLKQHLLTHTGTKPFLCGECVYSCCDRRALNNHLHKVHGYEGLRN